MGFWRLILALVCVVAGFWGDCLLGMAQETDPGPKLLARFDQSDESLRTLYLYAERELDAVYVWLGDRWTLATSVGTKKTDERPAHFVYRVSTRFTPSDGRKLHVNSWSPTRETTYRHELQIQHLDDLYRVTARHIETRSRAEYLAAKRQRTRIAPSHSFSQPVQRTGPSGVAGDQYGFLPLLNQYRASRGLNPVVHDPALSQDAHTNNSMSSPHGFMVRGRVQNWGAGYATANDILRG